MRMQIIDAIRMAGVVGAGGAGLPTHVKADASVDTVLVNGASCEPLLMSDPHLMESHIDTLIQGLEALMNCTGAEKGIICLKGKHDKAVQTAQTAVQSKNHLEVFALEDFYPAGDEQVLVNEVLGRTVPEAGLPLQVGVVVANVETLCNVADALAGKPVTHRYVTVTGEVRNPMIVRVPVGTLAADILDFAGGALLNDYVVVDGGPMMGRVLPDTQRPATKTTSGLIVLPPDHTVVARKIMDPERVRRITTSMCCQCSQCTDLCPRNLLGHRLNPHKLMRAAQTMTADNPAALEALLCSECGICEKFACPMQISPREVNAQLKVALRAARARWTTSQTPPVNNMFKAVRHIPTSRLLQRLDLVRYDTHPTFAGEYTPKMVRIPLSQHIGIPATPVVTPGMTVYQGDLIGDGPEKGMGARVHASISGIVESVENGIITIKA